MTDAPLDVRPLDLSEWLPAAFERDRHERLETMAASGIRPVRALAAAIVALDVRLRRPSAPTPPPTAPVAPGADRPRRARRTARPGRPLRADRPLRAERPLRADRPPPGLEAEAGPARTFGVCDEDAWTRWAAGQASDQRLAELDAEMERPQPTLQHATQRWNAWLDRLAERDHAVTVRVRRRLPGLRP